jgi:hypothetical protein
MSKPAKIAFQRAANLSRGMVAYPTLKLPSTTAIDMKWQTDDGFDWEEDRDFGTSICDYLCGLPFASLPADVNPLAPTRLRIAA